MTETEHIKQELKLISFEQAQRLQPKLTRYKVKQGFVEGTLTDHRKDGERELKLCEEEVKAWLPKQPKWKVPEEAEDLLTMEEAKLYVGVSRDTIKRKVECEESPLPEYRFGNQLFYSPEDLDECFGISPSERARMYLERINSEKAHGELKTLLSKLMSGSHEDFTSHISNNE